MREVHEFGTISTLRSRTACSRPTVVVDDHWRKARGLYVRKSGEEFLRALRGLGSALAAGCFLVLVSNQILGRAYYSANDLFLIWLVSGRDFFIQLNPAYAGPNPVLRTNPELTDLDNGIEGLPQHKSRGTFRIFCVGGSTTRGWPFHPRLSYPQLLSLYLKDALPTRRVEVINAGLMAFDSSSDVSLVRELVHDDPDLFLIYEGRNEKMLLPLHMGWRARVLKAHAWLLRHVYVYDFLRRRVFHRRTQFDHARAETRWAWGGKQPQPEALRRTLEGNLDTMLDLARRHRCRMAVLTQALGPEEIGHRGTMADINAWLKDFAARRHVPLIDTEADFEGSGRPMEDLVIPWPVHPDVSGYILMAKSVCRALKERGLLAPAQEWRMDQIRPDGWYLQKLGVSPRFLTQAYRRLGNLLAGQKQGALGQRYLVRARLLESRFGKDFLRRLLVSRNR